MRTALILTAIMILASCQPSEQVSLEETSQTTRSEAIIKSTPKSTYAQTIDNPKSMKDFFLIMPSRFLEGISTDKDKEALLDRAGKALQIDEKSETLSAGSVGEWHNQISRLTKRNDESIFAVMSKRSDAYCDSWKSSFLTYKDMTWSDITDQIIPALSFKDFCQDLGLIRKITELASQEQLTVEIQHRLENDKKHIESRINFCFEEGYQPDPQLLALTSNTKRLVWEEDQFVLEESDELWDEFITTIE